MLLKTTAPMYKLRGKWHEYQGIPALATYHPASLLPSRSPENKVHAWADLQMVMQRLGLKVPEKGAKR
jgi:uracil-DNA glycosylase